MKPEGGRASSAEPGLASLPARATFLATVSLIIGVGLAGLLGPASAAAAVARHGNVVMGTVLTVTVVAEPRSSALALAEAAIEEARRWDDALTIWRKDGELARLNGQAGQGPVDVGARLHRGLTAMRTYADETGGAFDAAVAVQPSSQATSPFRGTQQVLTLRRGQAILAAGARLDPGAIGKGLALDAMRTLLLEAGATAAFLDFGGSSQTALGAAPGDPSGWTVVVTGLGEGESHGTVKLRDESLSTSRAGAVDTTPVLDPRSGGAVPTERLAVVRDASAARADAWATALVVLGPEGLSGAPSQSLVGLYQDVDGTEVAPGFFGNPDGYGRSPKPPLPDAGPSDDARRP